MAENAAFTPRLPLDASGARDSARRAPISTASIAWRVGVGVLIAVIWLIPIKSYRLPVSLPFNLEPYRIVIIALLFALVLSVLVAGRRLDAGGHGLPVLLLAAAGMASFISARKSIEEEGLQTQALKSLTYLLSFVVAFILVASVVRALEDIVAVVTMIAVGAVIVAVAAMIESRTHYDPFDHLQSVFPFLHHDRAALTFARGGRLRVHASAQHPIALGVALTVCAPFAVYLARRARSKLASYLWIAAALVIITAALTTQSRTVPVVLVGMILTALWMRPRQVARRWPLLLVVVAFVHLASPRTLGTVYNAFTPRGGLVSQQEQRAGLGGSGRLADVGPGLRLWETAPVFGHGVGTNATRGGAGGLDAASPLAQNAIIFDDQYLASLVEFGIVGFLAVLWLVVGVAVKVGRVAKRTPGPLGDLLVAASTACAGYAVSMATFDAFSFVQVTLLFFVIAALGLQARRLALQPGSVSYSAAASTSSPAP